MQTKSDSPPFGGRITLSANERIAEFIDFAIQDKFAYVNKLKRLHRECEPEKYLRFAINSAIILPYIYGEAGLLSLKITEGGLDDVKRK